MTSATEEPADEPEPFDPSELPEEFTPEYFRKMPIRQLETIEENLDALSPRQRETFEDARRTVMKPITDKLQSLIPPIDLRPFRLAPSPAAVRLIEAYNTSDARRLQHMRIAADLLTPRRDATVHVPPATAHVEALAPEVTTVDDLEQKIDRDADTLAVLGSMLELMQQQHLSSTRGAFFAVIVSLSVIVAGVAPIVAAPDWDERLQILLISAAVGALGFFAYLGVRWWQGRADTPPTTSGS